MSTTSSIVVVVVVIVIITFFWFTFRFYDPFEIGINKARKDFPKVAETLGLKFTAPVTDEELGELNGKFRGQTVRVAPDDSAKIEVVFDTRIKVHISNSEPVRTLANEGMDAFDFQDAAANKLFTTRFASPSLVDKLASSQKMFAFVKAFNNHWGSELSDLEYSNGYLYVTFKYGFQKYIPAKDIEPMLKDLVSLAEILETL